MYIYIYFDAYLCCSVISVNWANPKQEKTESHTQHPKQIPTPPTGPTATAEPNSGSAAPPMLHSVLASGEFIVHIMNWSMEIQIN